MSPGTRRTGGSRCRWSRCVLALALSAGVPGPTGAQEPAEVGVGDRVRITLDGAGAATTGWIDRRGEGELVMVREEGHELLRIPESSIEGMEVSLVRRSFGRRFGSGALPGLVVGLVAGFVLQDVLVEDCTGVFCFEDIERLNVVTMSLAGGMAAGGLVGVAVVPGERWARARLAPGPGEGAALEVSLRLPAPGSR